MGLMDFFKKGKEKAVEKTEVAPRRPSAPSQPESAPRTSEPEQQTARDYTIQSGDSLSKIARQFYGNPDDWQKIYEANRDKIKDPNMIYPGQKIMIP